MKGVVLAGTQSGVGKTVATLATLVALESAGRDVQPAKAGPDFIDPSHHRTVTDTPSRSLDPWLSGSEGTRRTYWRGDGDVCVVEGMMGLYDGSVCSTARVAACLDLPVVLVVDASAGMESVAATALGFRAYADRVDADVDVVGVLAQQAHGGRHAEGIREALPEELTYFGRIPPRSDLEIPDRHLGLVLGEESPVDREALAAAAEGVRTDRLLAAMEPARRPAGSGQTTRRRPTPRRRRPSPSPGTRRSVSSTPRRSNGSDRARPSNSSRRSPGTRCPTPTPSTSRVATPSGSAPNWPTQ